MSRRSRRYRNALGKVDRTRKYELGEAIDVLKKLDHAKFDETVEVSIKLGIDPKRSEQMVRGAFALPKGLGKEKRVIVFAEGELAEAAKAAGALDAGGSELVEKVEKGWLDFDVAVAEPRMMRMVSRLGRILGPKGLMPSPKSGTVTERVADAVREYRAGKVEYRADDGGNLHVPVGKLSFPKEALEENVREFLAHIASVRPASAKGVFVQKVCLSSSMGPSMQLVGQG